MSNLPPSYKVKPIPFIVPNGGSHFSNLVYGYLRYGSTNFSQMTLLLKNQRPTHSAMLHKQHTISITILKWAERKRPAQSYMIKLFALGWACESKQLPNPKHQRSSAYDNEPVNQLDTTLCNIEHLLYARHFSHDNLAA